MSTCALVRVDGLVLHVRGLDAIAGSPVLDVKAHFVEMGPRGMVRQPDWSREIMRGTGSTTLPPGGRPRSLANR